MGTWTTFVCPLWCFCWMVGAYPQTNTLVSKYEEYFVEHQISATQAKNAALSIDLDSFFTPFGCQECTRAEILYCEGRSFIEDHCCCDRRYHEELPYIPHTCYLGVKLCRPIMGHCDDYTRLRKCCCDKHTLQIWKAKSAASNYFHLDNIYSILLTSYLLNRFYNLFVR